MPHVPHRVVLRRSLRYVLAALSGRARHTHLTSPHLIRRHCPPRRSDGDRRRPQSRADVEVCSAAIRSVAGLWLLQAYTHTHDATFVLRLPTQLQGIPGKATVHSLQLWRGNMPVRQQLLLSARVP